MPDSITEQAKAIAFCFIMINDLGCDGLRRKSFIYKVSRKIIPAPNPSYE
ncbi:MAG: hypothetical protein AB4060_09960 [Crocosphaera sp.]